MKCLYPVFQVTIWAFALLFIVFYVSGTLAISFLRESWNFVWLMAED